ncbi:GDSL lipase/esterase [Syncephalis plumigaleata]|nr:GDSL lipase/esterase [Syncephalis plumigaleata]
MYSSSFTIASVLLASIKATAIAGALNVNTYNNVIVFGNSVSDNGNAFRLTKGAYPDPDLFYQGRYSNGPIWIDQLQSKFHPSVEDYAYGGATTDDRLVPSVSSDANVPVPSIHDQVTKLYAGKQTSKEKKIKHALHIIEPANNDYIYTAGPKMDTNTTFISECVGNVVDSVDSLYKLGARNVLVFGVAAMELTPYFLSQPKPVQTAVEKTSTAHNKLLKTRLAEYRKQHSDIKLYYFDFKNYMVNVISKSDQYNLKNTVASCLSQDRKTRCANPTEYFFWDMFHPTTRGHELLLEDLLLSSHIV